MINGKSRLLVPCIACLLIITLFACAQPPKEEDGEYVYNLPPGMFTGKVVNDLSLDPLSLPLEGAKVSVTGLPLSDLTDIDGDFNINSIPPGAYHVEVTKDIDGDGLADVVGSDTIVVSASRGASKRIMAPEAGRIMGRVTLDGAQTGNGMIRVCIEGTDYCALTDDVGNYSMSHLGCKRTWKVVANKECFSSAAVENVYVNCGIGVPVYVPEMSLAFHGCGPAPEFGAIAGRAMLAGERDHFGIMITLSNGMAAVTTREGVYEVGGLVPGVYSMVAAKDGWISAGVRNVEVVAGRTVTLPDLYLVAEEPDCDGDGIPNSQDLDDDNDGFPDLEEIEYGSLPCDPNSVPLGSVQGTVSDAADGSPVIDALVAVEGADIFACTDLAGAFNMDGVHAGPASLLVSHPGYLSAKAVVSVAAGRITPVSVRLDPKPQNTLPTAVILSPAPGSQVAFGEPVWFSGMVADAEDPAEVLLVRWTSSINGELASMPANPDGSVSFGTASLSAGIHVITLSVMDRQMGEGSDSIALEVVSSDPAVPRVCVDQSFLDFRSDLNMLRLNISNCGEGVLEWMAMSDQRWLSARPLTGFVDGGRMQTVEVYVDRTGLVPNTAYRATLTVESNGGTVIINVSLLVGP